MASGQLVLSWLVEHANIQVGVRCQSLLVSQALDILNETCFLLI